MNRTQWSISIIAAVLLAAFLALYAELPGVTRYWIWPDPDPTALAFVTAWFAGGASALLWIGVSGTFAALRPLLLTLLIACAGVSWELFRYARQPITGNDRYMPYAFIMFGVATIAGAILVWLRRLPAQPDSPIPSTIPRVFLLPSALLLFTGVSLIRDFDRVFPVPLPPDVSAVCGWFFLASSVYYLSSVVQPTRSNAVGQLLSFVVYDLLLIPPYMLLLRSVDPAHRASLLIYLTVLFSTLIFCTWYLIAHPQTRLARAAGPPISADMAAS